MGIAKTEKKEQARDLFVNAGLQLKEIGKILTIPPQTLTKWSKAEEWELHKTAQQVTTGKIITGWYNSLKTINEAIAEQGGLPTNAQTDQISKIADAIQKLSKKENLSMYHTVLKEFLNDLLQIDTEAAKIYGPLMLDFMTRKATQLTNR